MSHNQDSTAGFGVANDASDSGTSSDVDADDGTTAPSNGTRTLPRFHFVENRQEFGDTCKKYKMDNLDGYSKSGGIETYILRDRENHDSDLCVFTYSKKPGDKGWMSINLIIQGKEHNGRPDHRIIHFQSNDTAFELFPPWDDMIESWTNTTLLYNAAQEPSEPAKAKASVPSVPSEPSKVSVEDLIRNQLSVRQTDLGVRGPISDNTVGMVLETCKNRANLIGNKVVRPHWPELRKNYMSLASSPSQPSGQNRY